ncbi:MAG: phage tail tape measure protein, partial [Oscillospiraceae bacterium]
MRAIEIIVKIAKGTKQSIQQSLDSIKGLFVTVSGKLDSKSTKKNIKQGLDTMPPQTISVNAKLNTAKSKKAIKSDIKKIDDIKIDVTADINMSKSKKLMKGKLKGALADTVIMQDINNGAQPISVQNISNISQSSDGLIAKLKLLSLAFYAIKSAAGAAWEKFTDINKAIVNLQMVTNQSYSETMKLVMGYNKMAQSFGATTTQVTSAAEEWLRQGKTIQETNKLIEQSMILSKVGLMSSELATKSLTSALKGYSYGVERASDVTDKLTRLDQDAAVTSRDLAESMSRTANSAALSGVSMDSLLGYLTVVQETTQKTAETVGESFKTIFSRLSNIKIGKFIDDDGQDLSDVESILNHFNIKLRDSNKEFRNFGDVINEVGERWKSFSSVEQRAISNSFAGVRQQENFLVLMNNFDKALQYAEISANSAGSSMQKFADYETGVEAKTNKLISSLEALSMDTINPDLVKGILDASTALVGLIDKTGLLKSAISGVAVFGLIKGLTALQVASISVKNNFTSMNQAMELGKTLNYSSSEKQLIQLAASTRVLNDSQIKLVLSGKKLSHTQLEQMFTAQGLSQAQAQAKIQALGLATAEGVVTTASVTLKGALQSLSAVIIANPVGVAIVAFSALAAVISYNQQKQEEYQQAIRDTALAAQEESNSFGTLIDRYTKLSQAEVKDDSVRAQLSDTQKDIVKLLHKEADGLDLVNGGYQDQISILQALSAERLSQMEQSLRAQTELAKRESTETFLIGGLRKGAALDYQEDLFSSGSAELKKLSELHIPNLKISFDSMSAGVGAKALGNPQEQIAAWNDAITALEKYGMTSGKTYTDLVSIRNNYSTILDAETEATKNLNEHIARTNILNLQQQNGIPKTVKQFDEFRQALINTAGSDKILQAVMLEMANTAFPQFTNGIVNAGQASLVSGQSFSAASNAIDTLQSAYKSIDEIVANYNEKGYLTVDNMQAVLALGDDYIGFLVDENGQIRLNKDGMLELANAKLDELEATALSNAINNIQSLTDEAVATEYLIGKTKEDTDATNENTEAKLKSLAAETALKGGNIALATEKVVSIYNKYKVVIDTTRASLGKYTVSTGSAKSATDALTASLNKQKKALDEQKAALDKQKAKQDSALRAVNKLLDDEIKKLEEQKAILADPEVAGSYGQRIKAIQDEMDALNAANDAREQAINLEKAQAEAERANSQKVHRIYREGIGFVWNTDQDAIAEANDKLEKIKLDKQLADLEAAKKKLQDTLAAEQKALDDNIKKLQGYKEK